jgi:hypothetical protein
MDNDFMEIDLSNENDAFELTEAKKRELDRRLEWGRHNPNQGPNMG